MTPDFAPRCCFLSQMLPGSVFIIIIINYHSQCIQDRPEASRRGHSTQQKEDPIDKSKFSSQASRYRKHLSLPRAGLKIRLPSLTTHSYPQMAGAHVCAIHDSVFRPMLRCFSHCALDKLRKSSVEKRMAEIEKAIQNGGAKLRPCLVIPNYLESARETSLGRRRICLMATFNDAAIAELPRMVRHFVVPVVTDSVDWDIKTFRPDERIHTTPRWKHGKNNVKSQWVICFTYEVKESALLKWRGGYHLDEEQGDALV
ncbi:hypothetical protein BT96DRAFT_988982 [Gymnopus androsaceus JB14]|uniref:Uncharacterized protein n=1 Tax=Gymnopus androsaceus JB14 TaxID=1447944 RepID=A0A6A4I2C6_9AGAR|nr:hypothetical protein BT96DRAFT_988982 [Gymnopus androsaceus JB14]